MNDSKHALIVVGSPKRRDSTSYVLGTTLAAGLKSHGWAIEEYFAASLPPSEADVDALTSAVDAADLIVVAVPLYVDHLPAGVIAALEQLYAKRDRLSPKSRMLVGIVNCGFPESNHNDTAIAVLKRFAAMAGFEWGGGLSRGMGGAIGARPLDKAGQAAFGVAAELALAAEALDKGCSVPDDVISRFANPPMPKWLYLFAGNLGWYWAACKQRTLFRLNNVPSACPPMSSTTK